LLGAAAQVAPQLAVELALGSALACQPADGTAASGAREAGERLGLVHAVGKAP
jgi:hypothetical protein